MLEANGYLETWSLPKLPTAETTIHATKLAPHRMDYLSYEGPVSNNRGQVTRVMSGQFVGEVFPDNSPQEFELTLWTDNKQLGVQFKFVDEDIWEIQFSSYG